MDYGRRKNREGGLLRDRFIDRLIVNRSEIIGNSRVSKPETHTHIVQSSEKLEIIGDGQYIFVDHLNI